MKRGNKLPFQRRYWETASFKSKVNKSSLKKKHKKAQNNLLGLFHFQMTETQIKVAKNKKGDFIGTLN